jgi:hypothetical protein
MISKNSSRFSRFVRVATLGALLPLSVAASSSVASANTWPGNNKQSETTQSQEPSPAATIFEQFALFVASLF